MGTPLPRFGPQKLAKSRGIEDIPPRTPLTLEHQKPQNQAPLLTDLGGESREKNHEGFMHTSPTKSQRERPPKRSKKITKKKALKTTKKNEREQHIQALRNHAESSIHHKEVHTRSSLPPNHASLSQDLTMKLSS
jgi:hypothetical protein